MCVCVCVCACVCVYTIKVAQPEVHQMTQLPTDSALCSDWSGGAHHSLCRKVRIWSQFKSKTAWSWKKIISSVLTIPEGGGRGRGVTTVLD